MTLHERVDAPHRVGLTVKDYLLLDEAGAFERYPRTQLIEGEIWVMSPIHLRHARGHAMLTVEIGAALKRIGSGLDLYTGPSTELSEDSLPEPDIVLAEPTEGRMLTARVVRLAIEISDSTLGFDMGRKARLYARTGVPEYWVLDAEAGTIHQMWAAAGEIYAGRREVVLGGTILAETIPDLAVDTSPL